LPPDSLACIHNAGARRLFEGGGDGAGEPSVLLGLEGLLAKVRARGEAITDDVFVCLLRAPAGPCVSPSRVEELVVGSDEGTAAHRFLSSCGVAPDEALQLVQSAVDYAGGTGLTRLRVSWSENGRQTVVQPFSSESEWPPRVQPAANTRSA
jgi:hypothetical protein